MTALAPGRIVAEDLGRHFSLSSSGRTLRARLLGYERHAPPREFWAVRHVDFEIEPGEAFAIVGRNGSGKSTVLKMLARIYGPSEGRCAVGGRLSSLLELGAGFHPEFNAIENIYLSAAIYGIPREEITRERDAIIEFAELEAFAHQPIKTFSSGMYARLGFSVAMHVKPDVLLLDEVLAVGDEAFVQKCLGRIAEYRRDGGTMIIVTHDPNVVQRVCDRALLLHDGEPVILDAAPKVIATYHERLAHEADATHHTHDHAPATGAFRVDLEIHDQAGQPRRSFTEGEPFSVHATVHPQIDLARAEFNVEFKDETGRPLTGNTLPDLAFRRDTPRTVTLEVPEPPFRDGVFEITVSIRDADTLEPRFLEEAMAAVTVIGDTRHTGGTIRLNASWR